MSIVSHLLPRLQRRHVSNLTSIRCGGTNQRSNVPAVKATTSVPGARTGIVNLTRKTWTLVQ